MESVSNTTNEPANLINKDQDDIYFKSDDFRMASMKVVPCSKRFVHDWTECPFAHPQEKARRRDPKLHSYTGIACPSMKKEGACAFGDHCPYAHNVFEYWLHPTRYRTQLCNDGSNCRRKICFFAHSLDELRVPACKPFVSPEGLASAAAAAASDTELKRAIGIVGDPLANLNEGVEMVYAPRMSADSIRQSTEWGEAPMPKPPSLEQSFLFSAAGRESHGITPREDSNDSEASPIGVFPITSEPSSVFQIGAHEQQIIDTVTRMLAEDKITASQAATILHEMLPINSLQMLQTRLGLSNKMAEDVSPNNTRRALSDVASVIPPDSFNPCMNQPMNQSPRQSMESSRSSFDTARFSLDGGRRTSSEAVTPWGGLEHAAYNPPAPAYPQYWATNQQQQNIQQSIQQQQLTTVPEGLPMINTSHRTGSNGHWPPSVRHSTGNMDTSAGRLTSDLGRMSFEEHEFVGTNKLHGQHMVSPTTVNPFTSSFFASSQQFGEQDNMPGRRRSSGGW